MSDDKALAPCPFCQVSLRGGLHSAFHPSSEEGALPCLLRGYELDEGDYAVWNTRYQAALPKGQESGLVERAKKYQASATRESGVHEIVGGLLGAIETLTRERDGALLREKAIGLTHQMVCETMQADVDKLTAQLSTLRRDTVAECEAVLVAERERHNKTEHGPYNKEAQQNARQRKSAIDQALNAIRALSPSTEQETT